MRRFIKRSSCLALAVILGLGLAHTALAGAGARDVSPLVQLHDLTQYPRLVQRGPGPNFDVCLRHCTQACQTEAETCHKSAKTADTERQCKSKQTACADRCRSSCSQ